MLCFCNRAYSYSIIFFFFPSVICYIFCNGSAWIVSCYFLCICCCSKYLFIYMFNKILATVIRAWYLFIYMLEISIYLFIYCFGKIYTLPYNQHCFLFFKKMSSSEIMLQIIQIIVESCGGRYIVGLGEASIIIDSEIFPKRKILGLQLKRISNKIAVTAKKTLVISVISL